MMPPDAALGTVYAYTAIDQNDPKHENDCYADMQRNRVGAGYCFFDRSTAATIIQVGDQARDKAKYECPCVQGDRFPGHAGASLRAPSQSFARDSSLSWTLGISQAQGSGQQHERVLTLFDVGNTQRLGDD
jgi:hypothetical protein